MDSIRSRRNAQERVDSLRTLRAELARLEKEGILTLTDEQRGCLDRHLNEILASLSTRFDIDTTESQKQVSWGMRIVSTIGGLALCVAIILFFFRYWGLLATPLQVSLLVATPIGLVVGAEFAARRERALYFALLISLVAFAAFVLNLSAVASIFNVTGSPAAFLAWGLFAVALAYRFRLLLLLAAGLVCLMAWVAAMINSWAGVQWEAIPEVPETMIAAGALTLLAAATIPHPPGTGFSAVYRGFGWLAVFSAMLVLSLAGFLSCLPLSTHSTEVVYQLAGMCLTAGAVWCGVRRGQEETIYLGAAFFLLFLNCRLADWLWDWMPKYMFFLLVAAVSLGLMFVFRRVRQRLAQGGTS